MARVKVFIDSDIFVRHLRYPQDKKSQTNQQFISLVREKRIEGFTSIYNLLEICGILSFNLSKGALYALYAGLRDEYQLKILFPRYSGEKIFFSPATVLSLMTKKLSFCDALIASVVEENYKKLNVFVSWNAVHFVDKLSVKVQTPVEIMRQLA
jgi:predicted nucleic acid-binding protein